MGFGANVARSLHPFPLLPKAGSKGYASAPALEPMERTVEANAQAGRIVRMGQPSEGLSAFYPTTER
jgi:hypothetical protein